MSNFILNFLLSLGTSGGCLSVWVCVWGLVWMPGCCLFSLWSLLRCLLPCGRWFWPLSCSVLQLLYLASSACGQCQHLLLSEPQVLEIWVLCTFLSSPSTEDTPNVCVGIHTCGMSPKPGLGHRGRRLLYWAFSHPAYFTLPHFLYRNHPKQKLEILWGCLLAEFQVGSGVKVSSALSILIQNSILELLLPFVGNNPEASIKEQVQSQSGFPLPLSPASSVQTWKEWENDTAPSVLSFLV